jgi:ech hydrogenase subunit E
MSDRFVAPLIPAHTLLDAVRVLRDDGWRMVTASAVLRETGPRVLYHFERAEELRHLAVELGPGESVPSIGDVYPGAFLVENEMKELQGLPVSDLKIDYGGHLYRDFDGIETLEPGRLGDNGEMFEIAGAMRLDSCVPVIGEQEVHPKSTRIPDGGDAPGGTGPAPRGTEAAPGSVPQSATATLERPAIGKTVVPFGPQHPVLAEPIQLELTLQDEVVVDVLPGLGFVHRGIEAAAEQRTFAEDLPLLERVCGICSVAHAVAYAQAVEGIAGVEIPRRARLLRTFWFELTRIHSHLLWLGLAGDAIGFEALFQSCWRIRERVLDLFSLTAGNRVILGVIALGGVRRDIPPSMIAAVRGGLDSVEAGLSELAPFVLGNEATAGRLAGVGVVGHDDAVALGLVGPTVRASGVATDVRTSGYAAHDELGVEPIIELGCDALARTVVRWREIGQSLQLCRDALDRLAGLPWQLTSPMPANLRGEGTSRVEAPRGELFYYIAADGDTHPARVRARTPTFANLPAVLKMLPGTQLAGVPVALLSIDPCLSCTER